MHQSTRGAGGGRMDLGRARGGLITGAFEGLVEVAEGRVNTKFRKRLRSMELWKYVGKGFHRA